MKRLFNFTFLFFISLNLSAAENWIASQPVKLVGGEDYNFMQPVWSPDGTQIAFTGANYSGIWVMDTKGENVRQILEDAAAGFGFEWSMDSKAIVARVAKYENYRRYNAIKLYDFQTDEERLLSDFRTMMTGLPHWADRDQKVFIFSRNELEVFNTGKTAPLPVNTPVNQQICFLHGDQLAIGDIIPREYTVFDPLENQRYLNPVISPDQSRVAFEVMGGDMFVMNVDGTGLIDLGVGNRPQWAPDSQYLVYMITTDDGYQFLSSDIYVINSDGSEKTQLTVTNDKLEMNPSWSPDGNHIAFDVANEGAIYIMEISK